jgi:hypothetical protein
VADEMFRLAVAELACFSKPSLHTAANEQPTVAEEGVATTEHLGRGRCERGDFAGRPGKSSGVVDLVILVLGLAMLIATEVENLNGRHHGSVDG